ncbi:indolepyruvate ferredoxin oxidoreductase [Rhizobiales bacterium GAS191]|nr:indolepyruvate ferredoxin oxidoreductase [Rhizobiales bacterium GAS191]
MGTLADAGHVDASVPRELGAIRLDDRYRLDRGRVLLSGTQALVRLALMQRRRDVDAGLNTAGFVSGYRGSPLAGLDREFMRAKAHLDAHHVVFRPGLNEDLAATAVWGSQQLELFPGARYDGVFSMWYGKGPGVDRSMDVIRHAHAAGTSSRGGTLMLVGDDHGAVSSTLPHQSEHNLISAMVPLLSPGGVGEFLDYGLLGFAMSRYSGSWVGFKCQTDIVECTANIDVDHSRLVIVQPELHLPGDGLGPRWPDGSHAMERRLVEHKLRAVTAFARANRIDRLMMDSSRARIGITASGKAWLDLLGALELLGIDAGRAERLGLRIYKIGLVWPLEPVGIAEFASGLKTILVVEEKRPVIEDAIKSLLFNLRDGERPRIYGKEDGSGRALLPSFGEINPRMVARALLVLLEPHDSELSQRLAAIDALEAAQPREFAPLGREPYFCSGCPHSISTRLPQGSRASTGIGCHMMVVGLEERATSTFTQMGGEGAAWTGMAPFTDEKHIFVNMGDGTYFHSGALAIRAAIASGVNVTYKILFNDAVAMTGGQPHDGNLTVPGIVEQVLAEGATRVAVVAEQPERWAGRLPRGVSLDHRDKLDKVQRKLREVEGVSVLVFDQVCAAEKRRRRKRGTLPVPERLAFINDLVCEGCGDCSAVSNCISIEPIDTEFGRKRVINQSSCNTDLSCIKGFCPSFVTVEGGKPRRGRPAAAGEAHFAVLPLPALPPLGRVYNMLLAGIGGTGVITISAILAEAAHIDGRGVLVLDQTGLAQKNGAVLSHIRIAEAPDRLSTVRIGIGEADLLLGFDMVVAASAGALTTSAPGRTHAVIDRHLAPTAAFVKNNATDFRQEAMLRAIRHAAAEGADFVDATSWTTMLMGDAILSNMMLLGYAWQKARVPIGLEALMRAIEINGTAVDANKRAFAWGRLAADDRKAMEASLGGTTEAAALPGLDEIVARRAAFLVAYQDAAYAARYRDLVAACRAAEAARTPGLTGFAEAVAISACKLMAYKDEYEVARLHADKAFTAKLDAAFEGEVKIRFHLAPPLLARPDPRTGAPAKISFGPWMLHVFRLLAKLKRLRGTLFDPFGRTAERRLERRLIADYVVLVTRLSEEITGDNHEIAVELARLAGEIRGYGHVKLASIKDVEARWQALLSRFERRAPCLAPPAPAVTGGTQ